ncbi:MAG: PD-(D/E)XK nuclease family protein [Acidimicrobiales bacterium]
MDLAAEQRAVVEHRGGRLLVAGGPGTGKTTALAARYLALVAEVPASAVLVLCPTRAAAGRFLDAALPRLRGGFDALPVTTVWGLAYDLVARHGEPPTLLSAAEQREEVARLLAAEGPARWPSCAALVGRRAFAGEVAAGVVDLQASFLGAEEALARAERAGDEHRARMADLVAFTARYRAALAGRHLVDGAGLLVAADHLLARPDVAVAEAGRLAHVLVDDAHLASPATGRLVRRLAAAAGPALAVAVATDPGVPVPPADPWAGLGDGDATRAALSTAFTPPPERALVTCSHPSVEPEAVAGELLAARDGGRPWSEMAVLVRTTAGRRARAVARALARHGIPAAGVPAAARDEPVVRAVLDVLRWVGGEATALERLVGAPVSGLDPAEARRVRAQSAAAAIPLEAHPRLAPLARLRADLVARAATATPHDLAFEVWRQCLTHLVATGPDAGGGEPAVRTTAAAGGGGQGWAGDGRALDALVAFLEGLARRAERRPGERLMEFLAAVEGEPDAAPWQAPARPATGDVVTIASIDGATGRHWPLVVVAGCVEGELPRVVARARLFDVAGLAEPTVPEPAERRNRALLAERRRFAVATARATDHVVAIAAPEPGVLLSRFVEGWPPAAVRLPLAPGRPPVTHPPTANPVPVVPDGTLRLSASQLATYDDCPLRYAFEYGLGARTEAGVHAELGTLVHRILAAFCDPEADRADIPHTREGLLALGERLWRDDLARFRPQVEEARRDCFAMLEAWWEKEGGDDRLAPEVLAVERRFEVEAGGHRLVGAIDRIDRADGGEGIRVVDYKTGRREPRPDAVADDVQLAVYHLAASRDPELAALGPPTQLRLLYLRSMHAFDQPVADDNEAATEARVAATAARILAEEFEPSVDADCRLCSFHRLCPLQDEGRMTGVQG